MERILDAVGSPAIKADDLYGWGSMDFPAGRRALDAIGYRGWVGIEDIKTPLGVEESVRFNVGYLRPLYPRSV